MIFIFDLQRLQLMSPKVKEEDCAAANMAENSDKNRDPTILPADRHRPYLMIRVEGTNDYINAVFLDVRINPLPNQTVAFYFSPCLFLCFSISQTHYASQNIPARAEVYTAAKV